MAKLWTVGLAIVFVASAFMAGCDGAGASASVKQTTEQPAAPGANNNGSKADNALFPVSDPPPPAEAKGAGIKVGGKAGG